LADIKTPTSAPILELYFSRNDNERHEQTNQCNQQTHPITTSPGGGDNAGILRNQNLSNLDLKLRY